MEPWLDSLSEDWDSEPQLSSPTSLIPQGKSSVARAPSQTQSRIPHLSQSVRKDSASFLKPRSSRGKAKANGQSILAERSASSLNLPASPRDSLRKSTTSNLPRRTSSNFSDSQSSVQHHSVGKSIENQETPEWKKRLVKGDDATSDGIDLFSPSKLEGMFAGPGPKDDDANQTLAEEIKVKPWGSLKLGQFSSTIEQYQSLRASRTRPPVMGPLHEVNEDGDEVEQDEEQAVNGLETDFERRDHGYDLSAISSDLVREGSLQGLVHRRVSNLEQPVSQPESREGNSTNASFMSKDPRWRTFSGQQEIRNEVISPITASATNTIRVSATNNSGRLVPDLLHGKLEQLQQQRPSSSSSDRDISYTSVQNRGDGDNQDMHPEMTSHSLPEDLSMGTQDLLSSRRPLIPTLQSAASNIEGKRRILAAQEHSTVPKPDQGSSQIFPSSPPVQPVTRYYDDNSSNLSDLLPELLEDTSIIRHSPSPTRPSSGRSPLKLFGNRDTYTSNKLLRVLSHYGQDASTRENSSEHEESLPQKDTIAGTELHMSQFGKGELDSFNFEKEVSRPKTSDPTQTKPVDKIFTNVRRSTGVDRHTPKQASIRQTDGADEKQKRLPSSPAKDRTPKRRRTLVKDEIFVQGVGSETMQEQVPDLSAAIAGKKRKDARPGESGEKADANVLAARTILRPKAGSRKSSAADQIPINSPDAAVDPAYQPVKLTEALAAELESFAKGVSEAHQDSRKPSLATKDYMEEANKVMEFIRARGKPKAKLSDIHEPLDISDLNSDDILDLEIDDDDSTKESFSRPPSRERPIKPREDRRIAKHDAQTAKQLQQYQEPDDLELLASTSAIGTLNVVDNQAASEAACVPIPEEAQESSPPNIRLRGPIDDIEQGLKSLTISDERQRTQSSVGSSNVTVPTGTSGSSGRKGIISHGTVSIPDRVGTMTFDHEKQMWIKHKVLANLAAAHAADHTPKSARDATLDEDPFQDIPDLSVDEQHELATKHSKNMNLQSKQYDEDNTVLSTKSADSIEEAQSHMDEDGETKLSELDQPVKSEVSKHEERLHEGYSSIEPITLHTTKKQARAVTIAFTSPVASQIPYVKPLSSSESDLDDDDDFLPPDDLEYDEYVPTPKVSNGRHNVVQIGAKRSLTNPNPLKNLVRASSMIHHSMPVINEDDHSNSDNEGLSLVHVANSIRSTPRAANDGALIQPASIYKGSSILCLTPLSDFTMHQADAANAGDESFVAARPHPKALLQAHGSLALSKDELVKAITDKAPNEPFWEKIRHLDLRDKKLSSLNALQEYCPSLEVLSVTGNSIVQLSGLPHTLRQLDISMNCLNDFTSWGHLHNLQRIDVSGNNLESLEAFDTLLHLRTLKASNNKIRDIEGIFDLNGLIHLDLSGNDMTSIDFQYADLTSLEKIDLSNNRLAVVRNVHCLHRLEHLALDNNSLRDFHAPTTVPMLKTLSIAHNELESVNLANLPSIQTLNIDDNSIRAVDGLGNSITLRSLSAREQKHSFDFVNTILAMPNECNELLLSSNVLADGLIVLPPYPHYNLRHLELAGCGLRALPMGFGDFFPNCRKLNLNFNAVSELSPLLGCVKLREVMLAGNRIQRLRRSCLVLSRLPFLSTLDMRDNPLTVGFYPPPIAKEGQSEPFVVVDRAAAKEEKWLQVLDETTALRRRMFELMLADGCQLLQRLDGLAFAGLEILGTEKVWAGLSSKGIIMKPTTAMTDDFYGQQTLKAIIQPTARPFDGRNVIQDGSNLVDHERSLLVE